MYQEDIVLSDTLREILPYSHLFTTSEKVEPIEADSRSDRGRKVKKIQRGWSKVQTFSFEMNNFQVPNVLNTTR